MQKQARSFCFTINNPTIDEFVFIDKLPYKYIICGIETGTNGTPHLQGYVQCKQTTKFERIKELLPRAHIEVSRGTPKSNFDYCSKDGYYIEVGDFPQQGERTDWKDINELIREGVDINQVADEYPAQYANNERGIRRLIELHQKDIEVFRVNVHQNNWEPMKGALVCKTIHDLEMWDGDEIIQILDYEENMEKYINYFENNNPVRLRRGYQLVTLKPKKVFYYS